MAARPRYLLIASMNVDPAHEDLFNEVYDEHVAFISAVPGVGNITRLKGLPFGILIGGSTIGMPAPDPIYTAIYELDDPKVLESREWADACEAGRWPGEVREHTRDRKHCLYKIR